MARAQSEMATTKTPVSRIQNGSPQTLTSFMMTLDHLIYTRGVCSGESSGVSEVVFCRVSLLEYGLMKL